MSLSTLTKLCEALILLIWRDGKVVEITPDEAEAMLREQKKQEGHD
ncbi:MAG: hypothetical protein HGA90_03470 [Alphaproteobacteria bacterium]|nr:hypothetical protein [Alphaproteobacteria bacterium]